MLSFPFGPHPGTIWPSKGWLAAGVARESGRCSSATAGSFGMPESVSADVTRLAQEKLFVLVESGWRRELV